MRPMMANGILYYRLTSMEIPKNIRSQGSHKFIIKPKHSLTHIRSENTDPDTLLSHHHETDLFLIHMAHKSKHFKDLLQEKGVANQDQFCEKHLFHSVCLKTILKTIIDRMVSERRLGKNLKGLNKGNLTEIQSQIWANISKEIELYKNEMAYRREKQQLQCVLAQRKQQILHQLQKLRADKLGQQIAV